MPIYRKFMILTSPRCGTHMLRTSIDTHPNAVCLTEMFNPDYTEKLYPFTESTPARAILDRYIFCDYPAEVNAVGFCLHRLDARFGNWPDLWKILEEMDDLAIISLRRENLLRRFCSFELAIQALRGHPSESRSFEKVYLQADFERHASKIKELDQRFRRHPLITVTYEELSDNYGPTMERVQEFLGLQLVALRPATRRQKAVRMSEKVANYEQLKADFAGTPWAAFFDD
jgi:LPS sulfotransferase NodH